MNCGFCGLDFELEQAEQVCGSCPIARGCHLVRCPHCGYEMPPESKMLGKLRKLRQQFAGGGNSITSQAELTERGSETISSLHEMLPGQAGEIASLVMEDAKALQKLLAMNLMPGVPISLLRRSPSFVLESGFSQFAVDEEIAKLIQVRIAPVPRSGMN